MIYQPKVLTSVVYIEVDSFLFDSSLTDVPQLEDHQFITSVQEQVEGALLEYTLSSSSSHLLGRFSHLMLCVSELRSLSALVEDYLYDRHLSGELHCNNLLLEMLHAKHEQR